MGAVGLDHSGVWYTVGAEAPYADSMIILVGLAWLGLLGWLFLLTRSFSRVLAWVFLVAGLLAPMALFYGSNRVIASHCTERSVLNGYSADNIYRFNIVSRQCLDKPGRQFEVRIGRAGNLEPLFTVFEGDDLSRPMGVTQRGRHEFAIIIAPANRAGGEARQPLIVRMDPVSGKPDNRYTYRWRLSEG